MFRNYKANLQKQQLKGCFENIFHFMPPVKISKTSLMRGIEYKTNHNNLTRQEIFQHEIATLSCFVLKFYVVTV